MTKTVDAKVNAKVVPDSETPEQKILRLQAENLEFDIAQKQVKAQEKNEKANKKESSDIIKELRAEFEAKFKFISIQDIKDYPMYIYENGIYKENGDAILRKEIANKYPDINNGILEEVVRKIRLLNLKPHNILNSFQEKVVLLNGVYNLNTDKFEEHSPLNYATTQIHINYDKNAKCPSILKYINDVVPLKYADSIEELFGYLLWKGNDFKVFFIFFGGNDSSKSTMQELMRLFIGGKEGTKCKSLSMQQIAQEKYTAAELYDAVANFQGDIKSGAIKDTAMLRLLTGNTDPVTGERKFGGFITFVNKSKLIFGCNRLPEIPEEEMEFIASRIFMIPFPHSFPKIDGFLNSFVTPEELSGLFNVAISGLKRLFKNKKFTNMPEKEELIKQYYSMSDPLTSFIHDCFEVNITEYVEKENLYEIKFQDYLKSKKLVSAISPDKFFKDFKRKVSLQFQGEIDWNRRIGNRGNQKPVIFGLRYAPPLGSDPGFINENNNNPTDNGSKGSEPHSNYTRINLNLKDNKNIDNINLYTSEGSLPLLPVTGEPKEKNNESEKSLKNNSLPLGSEGDNFRTSQSEIPEWLENGFQSEDEYNYYMDLSEKMLREQEEQHETAMELYKKCFLIPEDPEPEPVMEPEDEPIAAH